jgi:hypothetical protein
MKYELGAGTSRLSLCFLRSDSTEGWRRSTARGYQTRAAQNNRVSTHFHPSDLQGRGRQNSGSKVESSVHATWPEDMDAERPFMEKNSKLNLTMMESESSPSTLEREQTQERGVSPTSSANRRTRLLGFGRRRRVAWRNNLASAPRNPIFLGHRRML